MDDPLPPWLTVSTGPAPAIPDGRTARIPAPAVIDGRAARTRAAFFEEAARALRLPAYFGRNWDALTDSLRDTGRVDLLVEHAEELLSAEPAEQLVTLLAVLAEAAGTGLTLTLRTDADHEAGLRRRIAAALP
ncbi:barstar family protein [Nonomuraea sp. SMC257]|uniref:Barstar family protein n=1 Tax=Nonomuraea montanisoli TaxID=2741721 RepID=A0A7Y6I547_9ACTN|nr:barstar family protein [Nonomuraea montanisoli]NUW30925.1 barstar family protein [Nonomuraea montanisoli]